MMDVKRCGRCKTVRPLSMFCSNKSKKDGKAATCKTCRSAIEKLDAPNAKKRRHARAQRDPAWVIKRKILMSFKSAKKKRCTDYMGCTTPLEEVLPFWDGKCNSCSIEILLFTTSVKEKNKGAFLDHCHKTGQFRGFLCAWCNFVIGHAKDNIEILRKCIAFLERHKERHPPTETGVLKKPAGRITEISSRPRDRP